MDEPHQVISGRLRQLLPPEVTWIEATREMWDHPLWGREAEFAPSGVDKRLREFSAGRACSRKALARLGVAGWPLLRGTRGEPLWPPGIVGSITRTADYCAAAVALQCEVPGLGIDAEQHRPLAEGVRQMVCSDEELGEWSCRDGAFAWETVIFSAKESVYKAWYPLTGRWLGFRDVHVEPTGRSAFAATIRNAEWGHHLLGRFNVADDLIVTTVLVEPRSRSRLPSGS